MDKIHPMYTLLFCIAFSIMAYFVILKRIYGREFSKHDELNKKVLNAPFLGKNCCSTWPISHFVLYAIVAYVWPDKWKELFALGVAWEFTEGGFGYLQTPRDQSPRFKNTRMSDGSIEYEQWWSSSYKDVLFNSAGIAAGLLLYKCTTDGHN